MEDRALSCLVALRDILGVAERNDRALARATGLTTAQMLVLRLVLSAHEITPKMIAQRAGVAPASATALIEKLAQLGYLTRRRSETDGRKYWVSLTPLGINVIESAPDPLHKRFSEAFADIPEWEQSMILAGLQRIEALLEEGAIPPVPGTEAHDLSAALTFPEESREGYAVDPALADKSHETTDQH